MFIFENALAEISRNTTIDAKVTVNGIELMQPERVGLNESQIFTNETGTFANSTSIFTNASTEHCSAKIQYPYFQIVINSDFPENVYQSRVNSENISLNRCRGIDIGI